MNTRNAFGRTITFRYTPAADGEEFVAYSLTSARLYSGFPTDAQRAASDGSELQNVTSWKLVNHEGAGPAGYEVVFNAIADPTPASSDAFAKYYVALNYLAQVGAVSTADVEQLALYRVDGFADKIRVAAQDVYNIDTTIEKLAESTLWTEAKIDIATADTDAKLAALGYEKRKLFNREKLDQSVARLAAAYCCYEFAGEGNQFWFQKGKNWEDRAQAMFNSAGFGYDSAGDGQPDPGTKAQSGGSVAFLR